MKQSDLGLKLSTKRTRKREFLDEMVRYRGLAKNAAQLTTLFALSNLWMARRKLMATTP